MDSLSYNLVKIKSGYFDLFYTLPIYLPRGKFQYIILTILALLLSSFVESIVFEKHFKIGLNKLWISLLLADIAIFLVRIPTLFLLTLIFFGKLINSKIDLINYSINSGIAALAIFLVWFLLLVLKMFFQKLIVEKRHCKLQRVSIKTLLLANWLSYSVLFLISWLLYNYSGLYTFVQKVSV